jgi:hypothetical protein
MARETLDLGLESGISGLEVGYTHGKIGDLGKKNGGVVDSAHRDKALGSSGERVLTS